MKEIGRHHLVLVDGKGKKGETQMSGLTDTMKRAVFDSTEYQVGDMVLVEVHNASQNTLYSTPI
jgi:tRNA A37 methylthiotransferase MiaB